MEIFITILIAFIIRDTIYCELKFWLIGKLINKKNCSILTIRTPNNVTVAHYYTLGKWIELGYTLKYSDFSLLTRKHRFILTNKLS